MAGAGGHQFFRETSRIHGKQASGPSVESSVLQAVVEHTHTHTHTHRHTEASLGGEGPLEKGMATLSSISALRIPWIEEPGRILSMGSQESDMT